ncbi:hypothetical protein ACF0H5_011360 [Mactra antiquata]
MVLVNRSKTLDLSGFPPDEPDPGIQENELRMREISAVMDRMEEDEKTFYLNGDCDNSLNYFDKPGSLSGTPRSSRPCSKQSDNRTLLHSGVRMTHKSSALSRSYSSPRQYSLASSKGYRSSSSLVDNLRKSTQPVIPRTDLTSASSLSFDYDQNEDIPLETLKQYIAPRRRLIETADIYTRACSHLGVIPSQTYIKQINTSRRVCMANTSLSHLTMKPLSISLVRDSRISHLDLSGNDIGPLGAMYIGDMMTSNDTIDELDLSNTSMGRSGLEALARCLPRNKSISVLRMESNSFDHTEIEFIVKLIKEVPNLRELYLGHNNLGYEGAKILSQELETNTTLKTLDLQWNHFRKQSATQLCMAIKLNQGLRRLDLSWNGLGKEGCIALARSLPKNKTLLDLDLTNNRIDVVALPFLLHGLVRNTSLTSLKLAKNPMTTDGAKAVVKAITGASKTNIRYLNIEDIPVDKEFTNLVRKLQEVRSINVDHGVEMYSAIELEMKEHDPHDLNRFDPVMVLVEYMRIDNLRLIDLFQFFDTSGRGMVSQDNLRAGVATLGLPLTEHHLDCIMHDIDKKRDGYIDLEEFMIAQRDMSKVIIQRTTRMKKKGKEDLGLKELRKILKELVEKRNKRNKEKASTRVKSAATTKGSGKPSTPGRKKIKTKKVSLTVTKPSLSTGKKK